MKEVYTLNDLRNWNSIGHEPGRPIRLGVIGDPVAHSFSPQMQNAAFEHSGIKMQYARFQISADELGEALERLGELDFVGANLTVPHKIMALSLMEDIDSDAKAIGAINTIKMENGRLVGFNTDGRGFSKAIREEFSVDLRDLRVLLLGAGGVARAIARQCAKENCERLVITNRTLKKAEELMTSLRDFFSGPRVLGPVARLQVIPWEESAFRSQIANIDLIVNATPLGLNHRDPSPIPARLLLPHLIVLDAIYCERRTPFVSAAIEAGARAANGLSMLLHQGAIAFELWFNRSAPLEVMRAALR
jgi:shikimate dehydrogenase